MFISNRLDDFVRNASNDELGIVDGTKSLSFKLWIGMNRKIIIMMMLEVVDWGRKYTDG